MGRPSGCFRANANVPTHFSRVVLISIGAIHRCLVVAAMVLLPTMSVQSAPEPPKPTGKWASEGAQGLLKSKVLDIVKQILSKNGGLILDVADSMVVDPLVEAATTNGTPDDKFDALMKALGTGGVKVAFPAFGLMLDGGKLVMGSALYTVDEMRAAAHDQQMEALILGQDQGGLLGSIGNPMAEQPFLKSPFMINRGITKDNFADKITSEETLRDLWFNRYRNTLTRDLPFSTADVDQVLKDGWPRLQQYWQLRQAERTVAKLGNALDKNLRGIVSGESNGIGRQADQTPETAGSSPSTTEPGINRYGSDYKHTNGGSAESCRAACLQDAKCRAWTWVRPGAQSIDGSNGAHCWLKSATPPPTPDANCTSGMVGNVHASLPTAQHASNAAGTQATCAQAVRDIASHGCEFPEVASDIGFNGANCGPTALYLRPRSKVNGFHSKGPDCIFNGGCYDLDKACSQMIAECRGSKTFPCR